MAIDRNAEPAGFAISGAIGDFLHLMELSVDPAHGRRGLGSALLAAVIERSVADGRAGVTLSTFRDVPFNAPFYARRGFREWPLAEAPQVLRERFFHEIPPQTDAATRVLMLRRNSARQDGGAEN